MKGALDEAAVASLVERARREVDEGRLPSCQMALARDGEVLFTTTLGDAAPDSRYVIFSATKPFVASAIWALMGEGEIDVDRRVCEYVPEFGTHGKDVITVDQVLQHTSGFPHAPFDPRDWDDRERRLGRFSSWRCNWEPGTRFEYHATSAHWVLAELIERVTGEDFRAYLRRRVLEPLGLTRFALGVPPADQDDVRALVPVGEVATADELREVLGIPELPVTEVTPEALLSFNRPEVRAVGVPGGGAVSDAADVARFYQALLHDDLGIWDPAVLADVTGVVRNTFVDYRGVPASRTRGLVVAGDDGRANVRGFGHTVSARAFGHDGAGGQIAWADPGTGLSFCFLTNGLEQHVLREWRRTTAIASRAATTAA